MPQPKNPYVELLLDFETMQVADDSVRYRPDPTVLPCTAFEIKVICDASGKVVVRGPPELAVKASGVWHSERIIQRVAAKDGPNTNQWNAIEVGLRTELEKAVRSGASFDADARDPGFVAKADVAVDATTTRKSRIKEYIGMGIVIALFVGGFLIYKQYGERFTPEGNRKNGESCTFDKSCASKNCHRGMTCQRPGYGTNYAAGEECSSDDNCASGNCSSGVCQRR
jgi:hypothetical protein